jgi:fumarylacetoacetate (FAA) hydrolase
MKLGTIKSENSLDGTLVVFSKDGLRYLPASQELKTEKANSLITALENWQQIEPKLQQIYKNLNENPSVGFKTQSEKTESCIPRTFLFADGSAFIHHIKLVRKARNAELPETLTTVPLMYQGDGGKFLTPTQDIPQIDFSHGTDFEAEVGVLTDFVPMGTSAEAALAHIKLFCLINDVSLRGLIPAELAQGFGFFQSKPSSALSPMAVTADELGQAWQGGRIHLPLNVELNREFFGQPNAGQMHFHFGQLIAHAAKTRNLPAGTLIGSGTVSNEDSDLGSGCLAEKRTLEQIHQGKPVTPFMKVGDQVRIWMNNEKGESIFGEIAQKVCKA